MLKREFINKLGNQQKKNKIKNKIYKYKYKIES